MADRKFTVKSKQKYLDDEDGIASGDDHTGSSSKSKRPRRSTRVDKQICDQSLGSSHNVRKKIQNENKNRKQISAAKIQKKEMEIMKSKDFAHNIDSKKDEDNGKSIISELSGAKFVGCHCSIAGGVSNAVTEAASLGAKAFALFVRNGRTWKMTPLAEEEAIKFRELCKENHFPPHLILPHGSYLLNCGSSNPETLKKSRETLIHELQRCEMLGLTLYNFHPGSACGDGTVEQCIDTIAESINLAHAQTKIVKTVIENMSCQGSTVGGKFEELKSIIDKVHDKSRIGVCLDTCHFFAAGYDLSTKGGLKNILEEFDSKVGMKYLCAMHLNDSKGKLGCHLDRHENIGKGQIGIDGFAQVMNDPQLNNIPMILETPPHDYAKEIQLLYSLVE